MSDDGLDEDDEQGDDATDETDADDDEDDGPSLEGRCGTCVYFIELRARPDGVGEGECRLGCWPAPLAATATCSQYKAYGSGWAERKRRRREGFGGRRRRDGEPARPARVLPREVDLDMDMEDFRAVLRDVIREELGVTDAPMGERWTGGEVVLVPGRRETQEKRIPIETLFNKIVMIRDKLRVLEQKINGNGKLSPEEKLQLQQYVTGCYGSLTTFNVLFRDAEDRFVGAKGSD